MKFCLSSSLSRNSLREADEIRVKWKNKNSIDTLVERYGEKPYILILEEDSELVKVELIHFDVVTGNNLIVSCKNIQQLKTIKDFGIKYMLDYEVPSTYELRAVADLGCEYAYVGLPLFFSLAATLDIDIKLRVIPTRCSDHKFPTEDGICGHWIRPEDLEEYDDYIDVVEFEDCAIRREETLFKVYKEQKTWSTNLNILVEDLDSNALNRLVNPDLIYHRLGCGQACKNYSTCHACYHALNLAQREKIEKLKKL